MTENRDTPGDSNNPTPHQDWGTMISAGLVGLGMLVITVNLIIFDVPAEVIEKLGRSVVWLQTGRWIGLVLSLAGGSTLLWYILRR